MSRLQRTSFLCMVGRTIIQRYGLQRNTAIHKASKPAIQHDGNTEQVKHGTRRSN
ncbi:hypothetical protein [Aulosira sp. FACHB-615]|uniref:hypothetical protein n=1 Tax=Aulosira sp. FACHB-615 TaxID=2692777 RepID=UPI0016897D39|nr:hypothetical protein [Aulosira sp. FACHB-615]MBD2488977.1 hypothetical protein [Aulosira sp. FACHB-615]